MHKASHVRQVSLHQNKVSLVGSTFSDFVGIWNCMYQSVLFSSSKHNTFWGHVPCKVSQIQVVNSSSSLWNLSIFCNSLNLICAGTLLKADILPQVTLILISSLSAFALLYPSSPGLMKETLKAPCVVDVGIGISAYWKSLTKVALDTPLRSSTTLLGVEKSKSILHWVKCTARSRICESSKDWRNRTLLSILLAAFQSIPDLTWMTLAGKSSQYSRSCDISWEKASLRFLLSLELEVKVRGRDYFHYWKLQHSRFS